MYLRRIVHCFAFIVPALGAAPAAAEPLVVASIKPVHSLVASVMGAVGEPGLLVEAAASPHTYALTPSRARMLERADVVFFVDPGLETFLAKPLQALSADARIVTLSRAEGVRLLPNREGGVWEGDGHEHHATHDHHEAGDDHDEHAVQTGHADDARAHGSYNMHIWLDPDNAAAMAGAIAAALSAVDPANADAYGRNARRLEMGLEDLGRDLGARLQPVADVPFLVFHDAYQYLERRYGLNAIGSITLSPERAPSARRVQEIHTRMQKIGRACVFAEPQFEPALLRTVVEGTQARTGQLDPLGAALEPGPDLYARLMQDLTGALVECLSEIASG